MITVDTTLQQALRAYEQALQEREKTPCEQRALHEAQQEVSRTACRVADLVSAAAADTVTQG